MPAEKNGTGNGHKSGNGHESGDADESGDAEHGAVVPDPRPLAGLRVIDVGTRISAPFCAGILGELGAEVVKVELPGQGDFMRTMGPFVTAPDGSSYSLAWAVEGRGRLGATCDLRQPEGQELFRLLAASADVVCENFRPGTMERWKLGPADLEPNLVYVRISVFGQDGPYSPRPGLDRLGIAYGGLLHLTGDPDRPPVRPGITISDYLTGVFAASWAVAALYTRDIRSGRETRGGGETREGPETRARSETGDDPITRNDSRGDDDNPRSSGTGAVIDAPLYGAILRVLEWTLAAYDRLGIVRQREGNRLSHSAPLDNYLTKDGAYVCIVAGSDANFSRLCRAMDRSELAEDPRFASLAERVARGNEINGIVADWTGSLDAREIEARCIECDVPVGTAYSAADIFSDPHMAARGDLVAVDDSVVGPIRQQAPFPRFAGIAPAPPAGAPQLGEHNKEVWCDMVGLSPAEFEGLVNRGIL